LIVPEQVNQKSHLVPNRKSGSIFIVQWRAIALPE